MTVIVAAASEAVARRIALARRIPDDGWVWMAPGVAEAYEARCAALGVETRVLRDRPAARVVTLNRGEREGRAA